MARALDQIMTEYNTIYDPQRDVYNKQLAALPAQQEAELKGLDAAKVDSFGQITQGANRRGVAFGGIPLEEQAKYLGANYLPAVANLKNRYAGLSSDLALRLAEVNAQQRKDALGVYQWEVEQDRIARDSARSGSGGSGGGGGFSFTNPYTFSGQQETASATPQQNFIGNNDYRGRLAYEANNGDKDARIALKYVGNDGKYDGPVASLAELNVLRQLGIQGNYYVPGTQQQSTGGGLNVRGGGYIPTSTGSLGGGLRRL